MRGDGKWEMNLVVAIDCNPLQPIAIRNYSPENMEQAPSRGHEASPQSRLGVGCKWCSSRKKLRGLSVPCEISIENSVAN